jgi:2-C-methyl-D-erythritol 4-phosphate cytidylyltransferase
MSEASQGAGHRCEQLGKATGIGVVVLAAGQGERLGRGPKSALELAGRSLLDHVVTAMGECAGVTEMVVTAPVSHLDQTDALLHATQPRVPTRVVAGGATRQDSSRKAIAALSPDVSWVAITDVARPLVSGAAIDDLMAGVADHASGTGEPACGAVPVVPVTDSLHLIGPNGAALVSPVDRERVRAAQTPQLFRRPCIRLAHELAVRDGTACTDDVGLMLWAGGSVVPVTGNSRNIKITFADDLAVAAALYS